jgi:hypothetical protein
LDPQGKDFGPNAKYFKHDIPEAKKLVAAAGHPNGFDYTAHYVTTAFYGANFPKWAEVVMGMAVDAGMRGVTDSVDPQAEWRPLYFNALGDFDGLAFSLHSPGTMRNKFFAVYNTEGSSFRGFSVSGSDKKDGDPYLQDLSVKIRGEFDLKKAQAMGHDVQRYDAAKLYTPNFPGGASGFAIGWPAVGNLGVYRGDADRELFTWVDTTKAPIKTG